MQSGMTQSTENTGKVESLSKGVGSHQGGGSAVSWGVARSVASRVSSLGPLRWYDQTALSNDFAELTEIAQERVERSTGLVVPSEVANSIVTDRAGWVNANLRSLERLLDPLLVSIGSPGGQALLGPISKVIAGAELGTLLGWMATRVLGQYDLMYVADDLAQSSLGSGDAVYFVGPNIVEMERKFGFPPRQFRLWIAIHELTHRAQFCAVPWMREHFVALVTETMKLTTPDPARMTETLKKLATMVREGKNPLAEESGIIGMMLGPEAKALVSRIQGLMSLLEGHGNVVMDRAATDLIPLGPQFSKTLSARRRNKSFPAKIVSQLVGMDAKMRQYTNGAKFIEEVERQGGRELFDLAWRGPEWLPSLEEIKNSASWVSRVTGESAPEAPQSV